MTLGRIQISMYVIWNGNGNNPAVILRSEEFFFASFFFGREKTLYVMKRIVQKRIRKVFSNYGYKDDDRLACSLCYLYIMRGDSHIYISGFDIFRKSGYRFELNPYERAVEIKHSYRGNFRIKLKTAYRSLRVSIFDFSNYHFKTFYLPFPSIR